MRVTHQTREVACLTTTPFASVWKASRPTRGVFLFNPMAGDRSVGASNSVMFGAMSSSVLRWLLGRSRTALACLLVTSASLAGGCVTLSDDLHSAREAYEDARYNHALAWLRDVERSAADLEPDEQVRFLYLRGMTAYRLGQRDEALYYLSLIARPAENAALEPSWRGNAERALAELTPTDKDHRAKAEAAR